MLPNKPPQFCQQSLECFLFGAVSRNQSDTTTGTAQFWVGLVQIGRQSTAGQGVKAEVGGCQQLILAGKPAQVRTHWLDGALNVSLSMSSTCQLCSSRNEPQNEAGERLHHLELPHCLQTITPCECKVQTSSQALNLNLR